MHISQSLQQHSPCVIPSHPGHVRMEKDEVMLLKCWDSRGDAHQEPGEKNGATFCGNHNHQKTAEALQGLNGIQVNESCSSLEYFGRSVEVLVPILQRNM